MKSIFIFWLFILASNIVFPQEWEYARMLTGFIVTANSSDIDNESNIIITGSFKLNIIYNDSIILSTDTTQNIRLIFIVKFDNAGQVLWAKKAGSIDNLDDFSYFVKTDYDNNIYVSGAFSGTANFDSQQLISQGILDFFIAKYDKNGNCLWVRSGGGSGYDYGGCICFTTDHKVLVSGAISGNAVFGSIPVNITGSNDFFIAKYDENGNLLSVFNDGYDATGSIIFTDQYNNIFITGTYQNTAQFGGIIKVSNGFTDNFLAKYNSHGIFCWVCVSGSSERDAPFDILSYNGIIYQYGYFSDNAVFGPDTLHSFGGYDLFLAKYDTTGNYLESIHLAGSEKDDNPGRMCKDQHNNFYFTGQFGDSCHFGNLLLANTGNADGFIAACDSLYHYKWVEIIKGTPNYKISPYSIHLDNNNFIYVSGHFKDIATFGDISLIGQITGSSFYAKLAHPDTIPSDTLLIFENDYNFPGSVFPNPSSGKFHLKFPLEAELSVFTCSGMVIHVKNQLPAENCFLIDLTSYPSGIYILKVNSNNTVFYRKLVRIN